MVLIMGSIILVIHNYSKSLKMNKLFDHSLPIILCGYFLLIAYGVVKLPQRRQQRFDEYMSRKRPLLLSTAYLVIALSIYLIIRDLL